MVTSRREEHGFECERCARVWTETYEVRESEELIGTPWRIYLREGVVMPVPAGSMRCPYCQGLRVRRLPFGASGALPTPC